MIECSWIIMSDRMFMDSPCLLSGQNTQNVLFCLALAQSDRSLQYSGGGWSGIHSLITCSCGWRQLCHGGPQELMSDAFWLHLHGLNNHVQLPHHDVVILNGSGDQSHFIQLLQLEMPLASHSNQGWKLGIFSLASNPGGGFTTCEFSGVGVVVPSLAEAVLITFSFSSLQHIGDWSFFFS